MPKDIHSDLVTIHMDNALSFSGVYEWVKRFREGRDSCGDDPRFGPTITCVNDSNIIHVSQMIEDGPHSTLEAVAMEVGISTGSAQTILTQSLGMKKVSA